MVKINYDRQTDNGFFEQVEFVEERVERIVVKGSGVEGRMFE